MTQIYLLVTTHWVFTVKFDGKNEIAKARLVVRGFLDKNQYRSTDVYAPVINGDVIRWTFSTATKFNMKIYTIDVCTAFLYGDLQKPVHIDIPRGVICQNKNTIALKLIKSMYVLRVSSRNWFVKLIDVLFNLGFINLITDQCVFL